MLRTDWDRIRSILLLSGEMWKSSATCCLRCPIRTWPSILTSDVMITRLYYIVLPGDALRWLLELFLEHATEINAKDKDKKTALHVAAEKGHVGVVDVLLKYAASSNMQDSKEQTALQIGRAHV